MADRQLRRSRLGLAALGPLHLQPHPDLLSGHAGLLVHQQRRDLLDSRVLVLRPGGRRLLRRNRPPANQGLPDGKLQLLDL